MCTVTYIPNKDRGFIFTSNRDEAPKRSATEIATEIIGNKVIKFPRDAHAKGTWIAISNKNQLVCILNGAFVKHKRKPAYRLSRGKMALDFFSHDNINEFVKNFEFNGMEPFTLIVFDNGNLYELRWDEAKLHNTKLDHSESHLWASCTLYDEEWQQKRQSWFEDWKKENPTKNQDNVLSFHKNAGEGNPKFDVVMNYQNIVRTTSITSIINSADKMSMRYEGLLDGKIENASLNLI